MSYLKEAFAGFVGGLTLVILDYLEDGKQPAAARKTKDQYFWTACIFWPVAGGALTWYSIDSGAIVNTIGAFSIGLAGPTTLKALGQKGVAIIGGTPNGAER